MKKKYAVLPLMLCGFFLVSGCSNKTSAVEPSTSSTITNDTDFPLLEGEGKENNPYLVKSYEDLIYMSELIRDDVDTHGVYFKQVNDIDTNEATWTPIGTYGIPFDGVYDGNNKTIDNLYIDTDVSFQGVFGFVTGTVKNLTSSGSIFVHLESAYSHSFCGGIAGAMNNTALIQNCHSSVDIYGDSYVGGIVGGQCYIDHLAFGNDAYSVIDGCSFSGHLSGDGSSAINENAKYFGGISGHSNGVIKNCTNDGFIDVNTNDKTEYVGGIVGYSYYANKIFTPSDELIPQLVIENCVNNGDVTGDHGVGGIAGCNFLQMNNCVNNGDIYGGKSTAGIVGINGSSNANKLNIAVIKDCINNGDVETYAASYAGGIVGYNYNSVIDCTNNGQVSGAPSTTRVGGIVAFNSKEVRGCTNNGSVTGFYSVGGCVGNNTEPAIVSDCINTGKVETTDKGYWAGGIVGYSNGSIVNSTNKGEVHAFSKVGGIAGQTELKTEVVGVNSCTNEGKVYCHMDNTIEGYPDAYLGGLIGYVSTAGFVKNCTFIKGEGKGEIIFNEGLNKTGNLFGYINESRTVSENNVEEQA